jgi:hypothetical protein
MSAVEQWPDVVPEASWATELMEDLLATTTQTPEELQDRARELRAKAAATNIDGFRSAALKLAARYEETAGALRVSG